MMKIESNRPFNFAAGPAMLPESILLEAQAEFLDWRGSGMSVLEIPLRSPAFEEMMDDAEVELRDILAIPNDYAVLFLGGPARLQFSMIPMNFLKKKHKAGYLVSGIWSELACKEAQKLFPSTYCLASTKATGGSCDYYRVPTADEWCLQPQTRYVYFTSNETVNGVQYHTLPSVGDLPLIADMTSCLLTETIDVSKYGLIFAGAQKNIAPAGLTIVIVKRALLKEQPELIPGMMDYRLHAEHSSRFATPPIFNCYFSLKMFRWIKAQGGISALSKCNDIKSSLLYSAIDQSNGFYQNRVDVSSRSKLNVCFYLKNDALEGRFLSQASEQGLLALKGHRLTGGIRASLYNAMPLSGVKALVDFMQRFAEEHQ